MVKTRSQTSGIVIKREEREEEVKPSLLLNGISNETRNRSTISKRRATATSNNYTFHSKVKFEEDQLKGPPPNSLERTKSPEIDSLSSEKIHQPLASRGISSHDQVKRLIGYIVDDGMTLKNASDKAKICLPTARKYYNRYLADPDHEIAVPQKRMPGYCPPITHEQIKALIRYIEDDKMTKLDASKKANMAPSTAKFYYQQYLNSSNHEIPAPRGKSSGKSFTPDQIKELISYIVNDKMSINQASDKVGMGHKSGSDYYLRYLNDPDHAIPMPKPMNLNSTRFCTYDRIKTLIDYIVRDKMTLIEAAKKSRMCTKTAKKYYMKYINDPDRNIPVVRNTTPTYTNCTQDQISAMIRLVKNDNMSIKEASEKVNMSNKSGRRYYKLYKDDPNHAIPSPIKRYPIPRPRATPRPCATPEQVKSLIGYIVKDKMTVNEASVKANLSLWNGKKFYRQYLNDPKHEIPVPFNPADNTGQCCSHDQVKKLISYIVDDNMSIRAAGAKAKINSTTASKYYYRYLNDPKKEVAEPKIDNSNRSCPQRQEQVRQLIRYIVDDKMSVISAAEKTNIPSTSACKYYKRYLRDPERKIPVPATPHKTPTREQLSDLINYIVNDKMSIVKAGKLAGIAKHTAARYYRMYKDDPNHNIPDPTLHSRQMSGFVRKTRRKRKDPGSVTLSENVSQGNSSNRRSRRLNPDADETAIKTEQM